jgi:HEAT repeat protein
MSCRLWNAFLPKEPVPAAGRHVKQQEKLRFVLRPAAPTRGTVTGGVYDDDRSESEADFSRRPRRTIEAAKRLIADDIVDAAQLAKVARNKKNRLWARIAAIYALGFADDESIAGPVLTDIVGDLDDIEECRAHAAEALGHLREPRTVPLMKKILARDDSPRVKRWCIYALSEIGGAKALGVLKTFALTNPTGEVGEELRAALSRR